MTLEFARHYILALYLVDPSLAEFDSSLDDNLNIDGSNYDQNISGDEVRPVSEHVRQYIQLLKLAIQRLGDWLKA